MKKKIKTVHTIDQIKWHLENNVIPKLNEKTIDTILKDIELFNEGQINLETPIGNGNVLFGEMCEDLNIDLVRK